MGTTHQAQEWLRLAEHYRHMSDGELIAIAKESSKLTEVAKQVLTMEVSRRRLNIAAEITQAPPEQAPARGKEYESAENHDPYAEDRELVELCRVWSLRDAFEVQRRLDLASIPFFAGEKESTGLHPGTMNFANGASIKVMRIGYPWARLALEGWEPKDEPASEKWHWDEKLDVSCPVCGSKDIVFEELIKSDGKASQKFLWTCDVCGHHWRDDGVAT